MTGPHICLIEDDPIMGESLVERFQLEGFRVDWHLGAYAARAAILANDYAVVLSDVRLADLDGDALYRQMLEDGHSLPPFILMTAYATVERAVDMLKLGVRDYVTKPFDLPRLVQTIRELTVNHDVNTHMPDENILGVSAAAQELAQLVPRIAGRASSVLITGESGVGKEVLARLIHRKADSTSIERPFVAVNCGAVAPTLAEAEFFGFERGAFTGADKQKRGYLEQANGGTLFLDEVGELSLPLQATLLRSIQEKRIRRLGAEQDIATQFDLVCATNRDLESMVKERLFREDLYYRINVVTLHVKPLRERPEDVYWLALRFISAMAQRLNESPKSLHPLTQLRLQEYSWPGNIRELHNRIEHACLVSPNAVLLPNDIFASDWQRTVPQQIPFPGEGTALNIYQNACERLYIEEMLLRYEGRITETAKALKISRKNLWEKMKRHNIEFVRLATATKQSAQRG
ncbi:sigma-54-dependent transcriptional regulator [Eoetvoesiella caeni]|uniref:Two component Fis family sigma54 specific transcriptional regulator n=1 Tax=Eoetvoesiella caeni TaxID=645616 RepID=A0A366HEX0_9BURK|nr:sigma-54 dependent transcriptional regulator [Eoetvoesiella caeni]MCI2808846.1 sigma-54 dependent transcriptional regulator [Eoetvoesiella caeni]NYT55653.1 sigma-54-dependent Fis family transcriptional regulator [Eoetvoesiella caeni]RBP40211.1 two component Fis family sigma54 specific transcriptional regulator [Eoetvoesiella caeni]